MAEFTWKFSEREKWIGRHPSLWFSVGRDSHRSAKGGYPELLYHHLMYFTRDVVILLGVVSDCEELVGITHRR